MPSKNAELKEKLQQIAKIFMFTKEIFLYTEYLHNPDTAEEIDVANNSPHALHIAFIRHIMFRTLILETAKLYSDKTADKYRLSAFTQSLRPSGHFKSLSIPEKDVDEWEVLISQNASIINDTLLLRDKLYAHTDPQKGDYTNMDFPLKNVSILLSVAEHIIKEVFRIVYNTEFITVTLGFDRKRFGILNLLAKAETQRQNEILTGWEGSQGSKSCRLTGRDLRSSM